MSCEECDGFLANCPNCGEQELDDRMDALETKVSELDSRVRYWADTAGDLCVRVLQLEAEVLRLRALAGEEVAHG